MSHGCQQYFNEQPQKRELQRLEDRAESIGLGCFNRDNKIHSISEKMKYFKKQVNRMTEMKKKAGEANEKKEVIEYEGD